MKKILLSMLVLATMIACTPKETTNEAGTEVKSDSIGTVTSTGPDVDLIKNAFKYFAIGDWTNLAASYADGAKSFHNVWPSESDTTAGLTIPQIIEVYKKQRELMDGNINLDKSIYEVVTMPDGNKYGHSWVEMSWKSKKGVTEKRIIFSSYGINEEGKITHHWPIYDPKDGVNIE
jgi:hypothetical protein